MTIETGNIVMRLVKTIEVEDHITYTKTITRVFLSEDGQAKAIETFMQGDANWRRAVTIRCAGLPAMPTEECTGEDCGSRYPCDACLAHQDWQAEMLDWAFQATDPDGFDEYDHPDDGCRKQKPIMFCGGFSPRAPGCAFAWEPYVTQKGGRLILRQSGGLDI